MFNFGSIIYFNSCPVGILCPTLDGVGDHTQVLLMLVNYSVMEFGPSVTFPLNKVLVNRSSHHTVSSSFPFKTRAFVAL